ncbi:MAG TPA: hypothetical protein VME43_03010, partial [Bryobacteraceae bacterium]|nr:hypothetical protein [Bryobacteraceae bacterium]
MRLALAGPQIVCSGDGVGDRAGGKYMEGRQAVMDMILTDATRARLEEKGIHAATSFVVAKGSYRVR